MASCTPSSSRLQMTSKLRTASRVWRRTKRAPLVESPSLEPLLRFDGAANRAVRGAFDASREESFVKKGKKQELTSRSTSRILNRGRASCCRDGIVVSGNAFFVVFVRVRDRAREFDASSSTRRSTMTKTGFSQRNSRLMNTPVHLIKMCHLAYYFIGRGRRRCETCGTNLFYKRARALGSTTTKLFGNDYFRFVYHISTRLTIVESSATTQLCLLLRTRARG